MKVNETSSTELQGLATLLADGSGAFPGVRLVQNKNIDNCLLAFAISTNGQLLVWKLDTNELVLKHERSLLSHRKQSTPVGFLVCIYKCSDHSEILSQRSIFS